MRKLIMLLLIFSLIFIISVNTLAVEIGGEFGVIMTGYWQEDTEFDSAITESLELQLLFPQVVNSEIQYAFKITKPLQNIIKNEEISYFSKKLYLRHRFNRFNLTIGRQPVSWSFGSLLNPVDYTLGSVAMDEEYNSKYTDALEAYIPYNWNSGLSLVSSFPQGFSGDSEQMKWGLRGRMGIQGYDLTLNYVQEPDHRYNPTVPKKRVGVTLKGDVADAGIYAAFGHYFAEGIESSNSYLLGLDYSYNINYFSKLTMQLEYLNLDNSDLALILGPYNIVKSENKNVKVLNGSIAYPIDDFSSISLMTMADLNSSNLFIVPSYQNTLPGNIDFDISCLFSVGKESKSSSLAVGFSYPF